MTLSRLRLTLIAGFPGGGGGGGGAEASVQAVRNSTAGISARSAGGCREDESVIPAHYAKSVPGREAETSPDLMVDARI
jgi:hypothetical protein